MFASAIESSRLEPQPLVLSVASASAACEKDVGSLEQGWIRVDAAWWNAGGYTPYGDHLRLGVTSGQVAFWVSFGFRISGPRGDKAHYVLHAQHFTHLMHTP